MLGTASPPDVRRGLRPAVQVCLRFGLRPWCGLCPIKTKGQARTRRLAQETIRLLTAGQSPRLTSGGKAETAHQAALLGKVGCLKSSPAQDQMPGIGVAQAGHLPAAVTFICRIT